MIRQSNCRPMNENPSRTFAIDYFLQTMIEDVAKVHTSLTSSRQRYPDCGTTKNSFETAALYQRLVVYKL